MPRLKDPHGRARERRAQILETALLVFGEKGYHAANIAEIAKRTGLGHGTFYRYFKNKLAIFDAVLDAIVADVGRVVTDEDADASTTLDEYRAQLGRIATRLLDVFARNRALARLLFREGFVVDTGFGPKARHAMDLFAAMTQAYLENGKRRGFLRDDLDAETSARAVNAMIFESVEQVTRSKRPHETAERWKHAVIGLMLDGMRAEPPKRAR